jgi:anti-sigma regulatory factor (Ser/Thr protein kinase)
LRAEHAEFARLQAFADEFAQQCGLPDDERSRLLIILDELFTNAVTHGRRPHSAKGTIAAALGWRAGRLRISFVDDGRPFDPLAFRAPDLEEGTDERGIGGLGIQIVRSLVHQARYRRHGDRNHLHLVRRVGSPSGGSPSGAAE